MALASPNIKKYDFIDALRGLAILGIIFTHSTLSIKPTNATLLRLAREGMTGVQLLFIVSALTICMSWAYRRNTEMFATRNFFIRRFFRIAPMFYLAIVFYIFVNGVSPTSWAPNGIKWWFIPITALFLHGFHPETNNSVVPGDWVIAVEMIFYFMVPFLVPLIKSIKSCIMFFILSLVLYRLNFILVQHLFVYPESQRSFVNVFAYFNFLSQFPVFVIGIFTYLIFQKNYPYRIIAIVCGILLFVLGFLFWYPLPKISVFLPPYNHMVILFHLPRRIVILSSFPHHIIAGALFAVFTILLANCSTRLLVNRFTIMLGKLSFSMYLIHFAVLTYFSRLGFSNLFPETNMASFLHFFCAVFVSVFLSFFLYKYIEQPGIAMGRRLITMLETRNKSSVG